MKNVRNVRNDPVVCTPAAPELLIKYKLNETMQSDPSRLSFYIYSHALEVHSRLAFY